MDEYSNAIIRNLVGDFMANNQNTHFSRGQSVFSQFFCQFPSPMGNMTMTSDGDSITGLWFDGQKYTNNTICQTLENKVLPVFDKTIQWLVQYFSGHQPDFDLPVCINTTPFRKSVLEMVKTIPYGETRSYGEISKLLSLKMKEKVVCPRAVAGAIAHNPIIIVIPCHRVIGANGQLTGFAAGIDRKIQLLDLEKAQVIR